MRFEVGFRRLHRIRDHPDVLPACREELSGAVGLNDDSVRFSIGFHAEFGPDRLDRLAKRVVAFRNEDLDSESTCGEQRTDVVAMDERYRSIGRELLKLSPQRFEPAHVVHQPAERAFRMHGSA